MNPAEFLLEQVNVDFSADKRLAMHGLKKMHQAWAFSSMAQQLSTIVAGYEAQPRQRHGDGPEFVAAAERKPGFLSLVLTLLQRSFVKSYRDVIAYGVRMGMYLGLAIMMGTVWVRLKTEQDYIQPYINAIVSVISTPTPPPLKKKRICHQRLSLWY